MKRISIISIFLAFAFTLMAQTPDQLFKQGNDAYAKGDFQEAADRYTDILNQGQASPELYYNLGNAYYRLDEMGLAVLCYERALKLRPNYRDCRENLDLAYSKTEDHIEVLPELFLKRWVRAIVSLFSVTGWCVILIILIAIYLAAIIFMRYFAAGRQRMTTFYCSWAIILLTAIALICFCVAKHQAKLHDNAIVLQPAVTVLSSPESTGVEKFILHEGTKVTIEEDLEPWYKIRIADGNTGWLPNDAIEII